MTIAERIRLAILKHRKNNCIEDIESQFDNIEMENDNYDRKEMIKTTALMFDETISDEEVKKRAELWYAADHLVNAEFLAKLAESPYAEVREGVAANTHTTEKTLELLLNDKDVCVRETAILNPNSPITKVRKLLDDKNPMVCDAVKRRIRSENSSTP